MPMGSPEIPPLEMDEKHKKFRISFQVIGPASAAKTNAFGKCTRLYELAEPHLPPYSKYTCDRYSVSVPEPTQGVGPSEHRYERA